MEKIVEVPSPNFNDRPQESIIDMLIIHYTGMPASKDAIDHMCNARTKVSAHYMIDELGRLYQLVCENKRAWHAGESRWRGNSDINDRSIGIELSNPGHDFGYRKFTEPQKITLIALSKQIISRHPIPARNIVGHSDVAPTRKKDPGELFDWRALSAEGIGNWPETSAREKEFIISKFNYKQALKEYGYNIDNLTAAVRAFQRHFLPADFGSQPNQNFFNKLEILSNNL